MPTIKEKAKREIRKRPSYTGKATASGGSIKNRKRATTADLSAGAKRMKDPMNRTLTVKKMGPPGAWRGGGVWEPSNIIRPLGLPPSGSGITDYRGKRKARQAYSRNRIGG